MATIEQLKAAIAAKEQAAQGQPQQAVQAMQPGVTESDIVKALAQKQKNQSLQQQAAEMTAKDTGAVETFFVESGRQFEQVPEGVKQIYNQYQLSDMNDELKALESQPDSVENRMRKQQLKNEIFKTQQTLGQQEIEQQKIKSMLDPLRKEHPIASFTGEIVGGTAAAPIPGLGPAKIFGSRLLGASAREAAAGAVVSGLEYEQPEQNRIDNVLMGAMFGGIFPPLSEAGMNTMRFLFKQRFGGKPPKDIDNATIQDLYQEAKELGVDLRAEDLSNNPFVKQLAESVEAMPAGSRAAKQQQVAQQQKAVDALQKDYTVGGMGDPDVIIQKGLKDKFKQLQQTKRNQYKKIDDMMQIYGEIPRINFRKALDQVSRELAKTPENLRDPNLVREIVNLAQTQGTGVNEIRAMINRLDSLETAAFSGAQNSAIGKDGVQYLTPLRQALDDDLDQFIDARAAMGDINAARIKTAKKGADSFYKQRILPFKKTQLRKLINDDEPESIVNYLLANQTKEGARKSRAKLLYDSLDNKGQKAVKLALINRAIAEGKPSPSSDLKFDSRRFTAALDNLENATNIFFNKNEKRKLDGLKRVLELTSSAPAAAERRMDQASLSNLLAMPFAALIDKTFGNKTVGPLLAGLARVKPGSPAEERLVNAIVRVTARQQTPELVEEYRKLTEEPD